MLTCMGCGFKSIKWKRWDYDICPICWWEDDRLGMEEPFEQWWPNDKTLYDHQQEIFKKIPLEIKEYKWFIRDENWQPIKPPE